MAARAGADGCDRGCLFMVSSSCECPLIRDRENYVDIDRHRQDPPLTGMDSVLILFSSTRGQPAFGTAGGPPSGPLRLGRPEGVQDVGQADERYGADDVEPEIRDLGEKEAGQDARLGDQGREEG